MTPPHKVLSRSRTKTFRALPSKPAAAVDERFRDLAQGRIGERLLAEGIGPGIVPAGADPGGERLRIDHRDIARCALKEAGVGFAREMQSTSGQESVPFR